MKRSFSNQDLDGDISTSFQPSSDAKENTQHVLDLKRFKPTGLPTTILNDSTSQSPFSPIDNTSEFGRVLVPSPLLMGPQLYKNPDSLVDQLPNELLFCILRCLPQETLTITCSRVSKRWKELIYTSLLTSVDFSKNRRWIKHLDCLSVLRYPNLQRLVLRKCNWVGDRELGLITRFAATLKILDLSGCADVTDFGLQQYVSQLTQLQKLMFGAKEQNRLKAATVHFCDGITDAGLQSLNTLVNLRELSLVRCKINGSSFVHLSTLTKLEELDLEWTKISDETLPVLKQWSNLKTLCLSNCRRITDMGVRQNIPQLTSLKNISFICTNLSDETLHQLSKINLERLAIYYSPNITDVGFYWISNMKHLIKFKYENIEEKNCKLTDAGFNLLGNLPNLQILKLSGLTEVSYNTMGNLTSLRNLRLLDRMRESGYKNLPPSLRQLHLSGHPSVTDDSLRNLLHLSDLHKLRLSDFSSVTPRGLLTFNNLCSLRIMRVSWCDQITVDAAKRGMRTFIERGGKLEIAYDDDEWNLVT